MGQTRSLTPSPEKHLLKVCVLRLQRYGLKRILVCFLAITSRGVFRDTAAVLAQVITVRLSVTSLTPVPISKRNGAHQ